MAHHSFLTELFINLKLINLIIALISLSASANVYRYKQQDFKHFLEVQKTKSPQKTEAIIRNEYNIFLKKWNKLQEFKNHYDPNIFQRDLKRVKNNTKRPTLLNKVLKAAGDRKSQIKYFIIPAHIDRELSYIYERTLLTGSKRDKEVRKKLNKVLQNREAFLKIGKDINAQYRRVILKKENSKKPMNIDPSIKEHPKLEYLYGEIARKWYKEVVPKTKENLPIEHFKFPDIWQLILLESKNNEDYSFIILEVPKTSIREWLNS